MNKYFMYTVSIVFIQIPSANSDRIKLFACFTYVDIIILKHPSSKLKADVLSTIIKITFIFFSQYFWEIILRPIYIIILYHFIFDK